MIKQRSVKTGCSGIKLVISRMDYGNAVLDWTVRRHWLQAKTKCYMRAATVVQVLRDLFYVLLHVLFYL